MQQVARELHLGARTHVVSRVDEHARGQREGFLQAYVGISRAADHHGETSLLSAGCTTGDRGVEQRHFTFGADGGEVDGRLGTDRRVDREDGAGRRAFEQARHDRADLRVVAHTDADDVRRRRELRQRRRRACALIDDFGDCVGSEIENCQSARPFRQPASHRASDVAEPDIAETGHRVGSHDRMTCPPSTLKICPVTQLASSESRNKHMPTRSSG